MYLRAHVSFLMQQLSNVQLERKGLEALVNVVMSRFGTKISGRLQNVLMDSVELSRPTRSAKEKKISMTLVTGLSVLEMQIMLIIDSLIAQQLQVIRKILVVILF
jgi:hypothetical protein